MVNKSPIEPATPPGRLERLYSIWERIGLGKFARHHVAPALDRRPRVDYDAQKYFESYHRSIFKEEFSDRITIRPEHDRMHARYHYTVVEASVIEALATQPVAQGRPGVLDVGSGAGHWIEFYLDAFEASRVQALEISRLAVEALRAKFKDNPKVTVDWGDVAAADFRLPQKVDIVNAVGVMFHIVDDTMWERAVRNLAATLNDGGLMVVGGQFGRRTLSVQFHNSDEFETSPTWTEVRRNQTKVVLVNKRIRSLRRWRHVAASAGLKVITVRKTRQHPGMITPENNILLLRKGGGG